MNKGIKVTLSLAAALGILAGCGNDDNVDKKEIDEKESVEVVESESTEKEEVAEEENASEGDSSMIESVSLDDYDVNEMQKELESKAVEMFHIFGKALETGDMSEYNALVDQYIINENLDTIFDENQDNKDFFKTQVDGLREVNDDATLKEYAEALQKIEVEDLEFREPSDGEALIIITYDALPEGFFSQSAVEFVYTKLNNGKAVLQDIKAR